MQMRPEIQITSMIKSMMDVVIPAIEPSNKLAVEQSQLIVGLLNLMASQLPVQFHFDRDELKRLSACAEKLDKVVPQEAELNPARRHLAQSRALAEATLDRCKHPPAELVASVRDLREAIGTMVTAIAATPNLEAALRVEKIVLDMSKAQLLRDRSLMKPQGWEPDPAALPAISALLDQ